MSCFREAAVRTRGGERASDALAVVDADRRAMVAVNMAGSDGRRKE
jgi:hypothetical protein